MAKYIRTEEGYKTLEEIGAVTAYTEFKRYKLIEKQSVSVPEYGCEELVTETVMPTKGATYFVTLNRTQYECVAWWNHNWECIVIGNGSLADMEGMGEDVPFVIDFYCEDNYTYAHLNADGGEYTISIDGLEPIHKLDKKYLPDSVINSIDNAQTMAETAQAMAETAQTMAEQKSDWNADEDEAGHVLNRTHWSETVYGEVLPLTKFKAIYALGDTNVALLPVAKFEVGKTYTVVYDDVTYVCEAKAVKSGNTTNVGIGNDRFFGGEQTTEPFAVGYDVTANMTGIIPLTDTESVHSVQIMGEKTVYHKIPREYLYSKRIEFTLGGEDVPGYWNAYTDTDIRDIINDAENGVFQYATITFPMDVDERTADMHLTMPLTSHETFTMDDGITVHRVQFECEMELDERYVFVITMDVAPEIGVGVSGLSKRVADSIKVDTAEVGQTIVVKSVDESGKPTEWEAVDFPESGTQPNWNQNDQNAPDYVKNRPFWTDDPVETVLFEGTVVNEDSPEIELIVGQEYTVTLDGAEYVLTAWDDGDGSVVIGGESIWWETDYVDTEPPFAVGVWDGGAWFYTINEGEEHTLLVVGHLVEIHKIDKKYLPSTVLTSSTIYPQCLANCFIIDKHPKIHFDYMPDVAVDPVISENVTLETWKEFVTMMTDDRYMKFWTTVVCSNIQIGDDGDITTEDYSSSVTFNVNETIDSMSAIGITTRDMHCVYSETSQTVEFLCYRQNTVTFDMVTSTTTYDHRER